MDAPLRCTNVFAHLSESACASLQKGLSNRIALSDNRSKQLLILTFKIKRSEYFLVPFSLINYLLVRMIHPLFAVINQPYQVESSVSYNESYSRRKELRIMEFPCK